MESCLEESQRWMAKACSSLAAATKLLEESLFYDVYWLATRERAEKCHQEAEAFVAQAEKSLS